MTSPIDYITLSSETMARNDLSLAERVVAGLVESFNARGVIMSNAAIGEFFLLSPKHISKILNRLQQKGLIAIENPKGKHRRIHLRTQAEVQALQPPPANGCLPRQPPPAGGITSACKRNINKKNIKNNNNDNNMHTQENSHFIKPTPEAVEAYAQSIGYSLDGQSFCDYYLSRGWTVGKARMRNWQAAVRIWKRNQGKYGRTHADTLPRVTKEVVNDGKYTTITA